MPQQIFTTLKIVALALVLSFGLSYALAWTSPTATPPGNNVAAPLNASATDQIKAGGITAGSLTTSGLTTTGTLKVTTGAGAAKVLTSDATGNATWQAGGSTIDPAPIGSIVSYAGATAPDGYLICDGSAISRTTYASLFTAIGTTYGAGNGSTTFNLPDLRGEFIRGLDGGRGVDAGRVLGSWQVDLFKSHTHWSGNAYAGTMMLQAGAQGGSSPNGGVLLAATGGAETRPRNVAMNYIIKAVNNSEMVLVSTAAGDNLGNHTATQALSLGTNNIIASGADSAYGSLTVQGAKGGYSGINLKDATGTTNYATVMANATWAGFYNSADTGWKWQVNNSGNSTQAGTVTASDVYGGGKWLSAAMTSTYQTAGLGGCAVANALTGACSCPAGDTSRLMFRAYFNGFYSSAPDSMYGCF